MASTLKGTVSGASFLRAPEAVLAMPNRMPADMEQLILRVRLGSPSESEAQRRPYIAGAGFARSSSLS